MKSAANFVSYIFHPLLMPTYVFIYIACINPYLLSGWNSPQMKIAISQVFINSFIFPVITVLLMKSLGFINNLELKTREERFIPFVATMIFYVWSYFVFKRSDLNEIFSDILLAGLISIILAFMLTIFFKKVSLHTIGAGLAFALILQTVPVAYINATPILLFAVLAGGLIGTSRLILQAHTTREVYYGYAIGILCMNFTLFL